MSQSLLSAPPVTRPAPHDGKTLSLPHVRREIVAPLIPRHGGGPVIISLPKISIQKDWTA